MGTKKKRKLDFDGIAYYLPSETFIIAFFFICEALHNASVK